MPEVETAPFPEYFESKDRGVDWELKCKVCGKRWAMTKGKSHSGPLHLLNHAYSHLPQDDDDGDDDE